MRKTILFCAFIFLPVLAMAQDVTFAWDPHEEAAQLVGFRLYQSKTPGVYSGPPVATFLGGNLTTGTIPKPGLGRYYFVLTAYITENLVDIESDYSNEVTLVVKPKPPRVISAIQTALKAPIKGAIQLARLIHPKRGLRIAE